MDVSSLASMTIWQEVAAGHVFLLASGHLV